MIEEWKPTLYGLEASSEGRIARGSKIVFQETTDKGYRRVQVTLRLYYYGGKKTSRRIWVKVHKLVAIAFHGRCPYIHEHVDHKDCDRANNRPENLQWVTVAENNRLAAERRKSKRQGIDAKAVNT